MLNKNSDQSKYTCRYSPRHPLAKYAVSQIDKLELRPQHIVKAMGYPQTQTIPACDRLRHVLSSDILGLNDTDVDIYFTANEFLRALLLVLDIRYQPFQADIAQIEYDLAHYPYPLPRYRLTADVDFEFTAGANWMSRGVAASKANAYLPKNIAKMNESERESIVLKCIDEHYKKYHGNLPYDGVIKGYRLITKQRNEIINRVEYGLPASSPSI
ncbi:hypothetical protein [Psychrobacter sp. 72-O-c]|uniref:hypothetical protein n=1 Tax=Psychrobacter sp. 72-O-c TaxID=2774125 RepID=UPI0019199038|nr:hypothetical protein [Psychrobacter sp. 72-O-c]